MSRATDEHSRLTRRAVLAGTSTAIVAAGAVSLPAIANEADAALLALKAEGAAEAAARRRRRRRCSIGRKRMSLSKEQRELLNALDDEEWRTVGYRLGNFHPWMADELVRQGLAERRERERKPGAHVYRRTIAGRRALGIQPDLGAA